MAAQANIYQFTQTYTNLQFRAIGSAPIVLIPAPINNGVTTHTGITIFTNSIWIRKLTGSAYTFTAAEIQIKYLSTTFRIAYYTGTAFNLAPSVETQPITGDSTTTEIAGENVNPIVLTTDDGSDSAAGTGSVIVSFMWSYINLSS